jgi:hypothetical protein
MNIYDKLDSNCMQGDGFVKGGIGGRPAYDLAKSSDAFSENRYCLRTIKLGEVLVNLSCPMTRKCH